MCSWRVWRRDDEAGHCRAAYRNHERVAGRRTGGPAVSLNVREKLSCKDRAYEVRGR